VNGRKEGRRFCLQILALLEGKGRRLNLRRTSWRKKHIVDFQSRFIEQIHPDDPVDKVDIDMLIVYNLRRRNVGTRGKNKGSQLVSVWTES
jgi:hypothetical protein